MRLTLECSDNELPDLFFSTAASGSASNGAAPDGLVVSFVDQRRESGILQSSIWLNLAVQVGSGILSNVAAALLVNWLSEHIRSKKVKSVLVDGKPVNADDLSGPVTEALGRVGSDDGASEN